MFEKTLYLRQHFFDRHEQDPVAFMVEAINRIGIQVLGMALDVNPAVFAQYLRRSTRCIELSRKFEFYINARSTLHGHGKVTNFHGAPDVVDFGSLMTEFSATDSSTGKQPPIFAGADRMETYNGCVYLSPRISCARASRKSCNI